MLSQEERQRMRLRAENCRIFTNAFPPYGPEVAADLLLLLAELEAVEKERDEAREELRIALAPAVASVCLKPSWAELQTQLFAAQAERDRLREALTVARACKPDEFEHVLASERTAQSFRRQAEMERDDLLAHRRKLEDKLIECAQAWNAERNRLREALQSVQWVSAAGAIWCPACNARKECGHKADCCICAALEGRP